MRRPRRDRDPSATAALYPAPPISEPVRRPTRSFGSRAPGQALRFEPARRTTRSFSSRAPGQALRFDGSADSIETPVGRALCGFGTRSPSRARRLCYALVVTLGVGLGTMVPAAGRERSPVALSIDDCVAVEPAQVRHLLALELGEPLCAGTTPPDATRATVTCHPGPAPAPPDMPPLIPAPPLTPAPPLASGYLVELRVDDAVTGKSLWRSITLQQADPGVRARLLALALAELLFASWAELLVTPQPAVPVAASTASAATRQATSVQLARKLPRPLPELGVQLAGLGAVHVQLGESAVAFGGGVRVTGDHRYHLGWDADVLFHHGETATALGAVSRDLVSTRAALLFHHRVPYMTLRAGLGGRLGAARLAGAATDPKAVLAASVWGPWAGPLITLGLSAAAARVRLDMSVEAGYVVEPVAARVGGVRAVAVEGTWLGIQLSLGGLVR